MRFMFDKWPRLVAEYKPTFGSIFASYLRPYTHWGYCDLDMVVGNLPLFLEQAELDAYDVVVRCGSVRIAGRCGLSPHDACDDLAHVWPVG